MLEKLHCPSCNAPLNYDGAQSTLRCPYCSTQIVIPEEWRAPADAEANEAAPADEAATAEATAYADWAGQAEVLAQVRGLVSNGNKTEAIRLYRDHFDTSTAHATAVVEAIEAELELAQQPAQKQVKVGRSPSPNHSSGGGCAGCAGPLVLLALVIIGVIFYTGATPTTVTQLVNRFSNMENITTVVNEVTTAVPGFKLPPDAEAFLETMNGTFATEEMRFGSEGTAPGQFEDARTLAVDPDGMIYVADFQSGRIQVFDPAGQFLNEWSIGPGKYVSQLAVDREGRLYVPYDDAINIHEGVTGLRLGALPVIDGAEWNQYEENVAVGADGRVYAVWDGDIMRFDPSGQPNLRIAAAIENATGATERVGSLAVNGVGDIFALGEIQGYVTRFASDGRFVDRFGGRGSNAANLNAPSAVATDSQGRIYVGDIAGIKVYSAQGQYLGAIGTINYPYGIAIDEGDNIFVTTGTEVIKFRAP